MGHGHPRHSKDHFDKEQAVSKIHSRSSSERGLGNTQQIDDEALGEGALLWCLSISRTVGKNKLKQKLPNFGKEDVEKEISDFIQIQQNDPVVKMPNVPLIFGKALPGGMQL